MGDKQVTWASLLPERLRGGPNSDYQKSLRARTAQDAANPVVAPQLPGVNAPLCMGGKTRRYYGGPVELAQGGPVYTPHKRREMELGGYTGHEPNGDVRPLKVAGVKDFEDHQGEYYVNAPVVEILGGPERVEAIIMDAAEERIAGAEQHPDVGGGQAPLVEPERPGFQFGGDTSFRDTRQQPGTVDFSRFANTPNIPVGGSAGTLRQPLPGQEVPDYPGRTLPGGDLYDPTRDISRLPTYDPLSDQYTQFGDTGPAALPPPPLGAQIDLTTRFQDAERFPRLPSPTPGGAPPTVFLPERPPAEVPPAAEEALPEAEAPPTVVVPERAPAEALEFGPTALPPVEAPPPEYPEPVATAADIYVDKSMRALSDLASGESELMESIVASTLQRFGSDVASGKAALRMELGQAGVSPQAADVLMQSYDRSARIARAGLEGDLAREVMKNAQTAVTQLASLATGQQQFAQSLGQRIKEFEETHDLSERNYEDQQTWTTLGFMIDSGASGEEIGDFVSRNLGLDIDFSHITNANQMSRFGASASMLSNLIGQYVTGGKRDELIDPATGNVILTDPVVKSQIDSMWLNTGQDASTIGSDAYNEYAQNTIESMVTVRSPAMATINQFSDAELTDAFIGADFLPDFTYGGKTGTEALRGALQYIHVRGGYDIDNEGNFTTDYDNEAWDILKPPTEAGVGEVIGLTGKPLWTVDSYAGKEYIVTPQGVKENTGTWGTEFRQPDGESWPAGKTIVKDDTVYTSTGNYGWNEQDKTVLEQAYAASGDPFGVDANAYFQSVAGGDYTSTEGKKVMEDRVNFLTRAGHDNNDWMKIRGLTTSDPVYSKILSDAPDVSTITVNEVDDAGYNSIVFTNLNSGYYREGDTLYYVPTQTANLYDWGGDDGQMAQVYNVSTGAWVWIDAKEIKKGNRIFSSQGETSDNDTAGHTNYTVAR